MIKRSSAHSRCALCDSKNFISFHHLVPRSCHRNKWFRKNFDKIDMRERGIDLCRRCHSFLHKQFPEKYLGRHLNTLAAIQENAVVQAYLAWARKQVARDVEMTSATDGGQEPTAESPFSRIDNDLEFAGKCSFMSGRKIST